MCLKLGDRTLTCTLLLTMMLTDSCPCPSHTIRMGLWQTFQPNLIFYLSYVLQPASSKSKLLALLPPPSPWPRGSRGRRTASWPSRRPGPRRPPAAWSCGREAARPRHNSTRWAAGGGCSQCSAASVFEVEAFAAPRHGPGAHVDETRRPGLHGALGRGGLRRRGAAVGAARVAARLRRGWRLRGEGVFPPGAAGSRWAGSPEAVCGGAGRRAREGSGRSGPRRTPGRRFC